MSNWQTAAQEFHSASEPWRKPLAELSAIVAAMRINAALASTHPDDRERWKDLVRRALEMCGEPT